MIDEIGEVEKDIDLVLLNKESFEVEEINEVPVTVKSKSGFGMLSLIVLLGAAVAGFVYVNKMK